MMANILLQQMLDAANKSFFIVILYYYFPAFVISPVGIIVCSLLMGFYASYLQHQATKKQADALQYIPSGINAQMLEQEVKRCGMQVGDVNLRYAYTDDAVAMTMGTTVIVDPMLWQGFADDTALTQVKDVLEKHILPTVPQGKKLLQEKIKAIMSPAAQRFIFKHELGHVFYRYSPKKIFLTGAIMALATASGILVALAGMGKFSSFTAVALGIIVAGFVNLLVTYASNAFFKAREERKADMFAVKYSTKEEMNAAADFFEQYDVPAQEYRDKMHTGVMAYIPLIFLIGYPASTVRVGYLRDAARI